MSEHIQASGGSVILLERIIYGLVYATHCKVLVYQFVAGLECHVFGNISLHCDLDVKGSPVNGRKVEGVVTVLVRVGICLYVAGNPARNIVGARNDDVRCGRGLCIDAYFRPFERFARRILHIAPDSLVVAAAVHRRNLGVGMERYVGEQVVRIPTPVHGSVIHDTLTARERHVGLRPGIIQVVLVGRRHYIEAWMRTAGIDVLGVRSPQLIWSTGIR